MTKQHTLKLAIGTMVYCTVREVQGWYSITAIRPRDGYIKINGFRTWNPPFNFELVDNKRQPFSA